MKQAERRAALASVGAVIGAGLASGREINVFFAKFGACSWAGIFAAAAVLCWTWLPTGRFQQAPRVMKICWQAALTALCVTTGGAMLSFTGEIVQIVLPVHAAAWWGMAGTVLLLLAARRRRMTAIARVSTALTLLLSGVMIYGALTPGRGAVPQALPGERLGGCLASGMCYGAFNAALALPVMNGVSASRESRGRAAVCACAVLVLLLAVGNAAMLSHPELRGETIPLLRITASFGKAGQWLCALVLLLAAFSTLLACQEGAASALGGCEGAGLMLIVLVALAGFGRITGNMYPALGCCCFILLAIDRIICKSKDVFHRHF